jgi:hypothetical protein
VIVVSFSRFQIQYIIFSSGDKFEKNEMGGACKPYGRGEAYTGFWWGNLRERDHLGDPGIDGRIILTFRNRASYI